MNTPRRWPGWVYSAGNEPDYRFSFANERTFLAWIRTSLALVAAGVALDVVDLSISPAAQQAASLVCITLGIVSAPLSWFRWAQAERAMRHSEPLPGVGVWAPVTVALLVAAFVIVGLSV